MNVRRVFLSMRKLLTAITELYCNKLNSAVKLIFNNFPTLKFQL